VSQVGSMAMCLGQPDGGLNRARVNEPARWQIDGNRQGKCGRTAVVVRRQLVGCLLGRPQGRAGDHAAGAIERQTARQRGARGIARDHAAYLGAQRADVGADSQPKRIVEVRQPGRRGIARTITSAAASPQH